MKKNKSFYKKRLMRNKTSVISIFIAAIFILSSAVVAIDISDNQGKSNTLEYELDQDIQTSTGRAPFAMSSESAPTAYTKSDSAELKNSQGNNYLSLSRDPMMYGISYAYSPGEGNGAYSFDCAEPATYEFIGNQPASYAMYAGTWTCTERWLTIDYSTGALYEIDPETADVTVIGGGGAGCNGLAYDPSSMLLYGASGSGLYLIDDETGVQEYIGAFGPTSLMIGIAINFDGVCYGWSISPDSLYTIDLTSGTATEVGALGYNLNYAQDGSFDDDGVLWLSAYVLTPYGGYIATVDLETGTMTLGDQLLGSAAEVCGSMIQWNCIPPEHDVKMEEIVHPQDGYAVDPLPIQLRVSNKGNHSEITDVQFEVIKCEEGPLLEETGFDTWLPAGWSTYGWQQSNTHYAVGVSPPEAAYTYPPYYSQGWLESTPVNATGFEKISVKFRMMLDKGSYSNTFFYLQYRKNASSPWRDASPWTNPVEDMEPWPWEVGCYGWGEDLGGEFQIRFYWPHYYYYLQYGSGIYIDDVQIIGCAGCAEYAEIVEDVEVPWDEEVLVDFPGWTPSEWQNPEFQDTWEEYPLSAYTLLDDDNVKNNKKQRLLKLYYPYLHDVGAFALGEMEDGPAQTFAVKTMIKNVGQYEECCFKTHVSISEIDFDSADFLLFEDFSPYYYFPPTGWTRTNTKWTGSSYNYCQQGDGGEARFYYYPSETNKFRLYSPGIDTTGYGAVAISFVHYLNHYNGPYNLLIETSPDGNTWTEVWKLENPGDIFTPEWIEIVTADNVGGSNFHVSVTFDGYSWNTNWWHVDSVSVYGVPIKEPELTDNMCIQEIIPGEELILEFDDWTPEFLQYETTGVKTYAAKTWTQMDDPEDDHRSNDQFQIGVELDYYHDAAVQQVTTPVRGRERHFYAVLAGYPGTCVWFDPEDPTKFNNIVTFPSSAFPQGATFVGDQEWVCDTNGNIYKDINNNPDDPDWESVGNSGTGGLVSLAYNLKDKVLYGMSTSSFYEIDQDTGKGTLIGSLGVSSLMISCAANADGVMYSYDLGFGTANTYTIDLETGKATVVGPTGVYLNYGQDMAYDFEEDKLLATIFNYNTFAAEYHEIDQENGKFTFIAGPLPDQTTCFAIPGGGIGVDVYVAPGNQNIGAIVANYGTFPERDMTCYASIDEYITDCENATNVYEDMIEDIDILEPLTGTKSLSFNDYLFAEEGPYVLTLEIVDDNDDIPKNNIFDWGIGVDDTAPTSSHELAIPAPNGKNGYYVSDLNVTVSAFDHTIGCETDGSGVKEIKYTIDGAGGTIPGNLGTFTITEDGNDILVEYWAIDWVGNVESKNSFSIDMDQTLCEIDEPDGVHWEAFQDGMFGDWYVRFWTNATDATSGMDRVEMYINDGLHEINASPDGARYDFVIMWSTAFETVTFSWKHFDRAGWDTYDEILGNEPFEKSYSSDTYTLNQKQVRSL